MSFLLVFLPAFFMAWPSYITFLAWYTGFLRRAICRDFDKIPVIATVWLIYPRLGNLFRLLGSGCILFYVKRNA